jgi:hypothetical protein
MRSRKQLAISLVMLVLPVILSAGENTDGAACPDGSNVAGINCSRCPDGTYVGGLSCRWDGQGYVAGPPTSRRDDPNRVLCPDGITYVIGSSCVLKPDGSFVGVN